MSRPRQLRLARLTTPAKRGIESRKGLQGWHQGWQARCGSGLQGSPPGTGQHPCAGARAEGDLVLGDAQGNAPRQWISHSKKIDDRRKNAIQKSKKCSKGRNLIEHFRRVLTKGPSESAAGTSVEGGRDGRKLKNGLRPRDNFLVR